MPKFKALIISLIFSFLVVTELSAQFYIYERPEKLAEFDNIQITFDDYQQRLIDILSVPEFSERLGDTFARSTLIALELQKNKVIISQDAVKTKLEELVRKAGGVENLKKSMARSFMDWYSLESAVRDAVGIEVIARKIYNIDKSQKVASDKLDSTVKEILKAYGNPVFNGCRKPCAMTVAGLDFMQRDLINFLLLKGDKSFLKAVLEGIISDKRIIHHAEKTDSMPTGLDIQKLISEKRETLKRQSIAKGLIKPLSMEEFLARQGLTVNEYMERDNFVAQAATIKLLQNKLTNEALENYYSQNKNRYLLVYIYQIFFPFNVDNPYKPVEVTEKVEKNAAAVVEEVSKKLAKLTAGSVNINTLKTLGDSVKGCVFEQVGFVCSDNELKLKLDPTAYNLDYVKNVFNRLVSPIKYPHPLLVNTAFKLKEGQISPILKTGLGFHFVLRAGERYPKDWQAIRDVIYAEMFEKEGIKLLKTLKNNYQTEILWQP